MERISALIEKLRNQFSEGADIEQLLLTTQLLEGELRYHRQKGTIPASPHVAVLMPNRVRQEPVTSNRVRPETVHNGNHAYQNGVEQPVREVPGNPEHERYMPHKREEAVQPVEQAEPQASAYVQPEAPIQPPPPAYVQPAAPVHTPPPAAPAYVPPAAPIQPPPPAPEFRAPEPEPIPFNPIKDVPTLTHQLPQEVRNSDAQRDLNDAIGGQGAPSLNDRLKGQQREISSVLTETPIRDLRKAIGINDRYVFISELFRGDETMYERSIKTINNFSIYQEAYYWMERELKLKLAWDTDRKSTQSFYQLVRRRFS